MNDKRAIILESTLIGLTTIERGPAVEATFFTKGFMGEYVQRIQVDGSPVWLGSRMHARFDLVLRPLYHSDDLESDEVLAKRLADRLYNWVLKDKGETDEKVRELKIDTLQQQIVLFLRQNGYERPALPKPEAP